METHIASALPSYPTFLLTLVRIHFRGTLISTIQAHVTLHSSCELVGFEALGDLSRERLYNVLTVSDSRSQNTIGHKISVDFIVQIVAINNATNVACGRQSPTIA
jgi:hypothetical protein